MFGGDGSAPTDSCGENSRYKTVLKVNMAVLGTCALHAQASVALPAHCCSTEGLPPACAGDGGVIHEEELNGGDLAAGFPELKSARGTGRSGSPLHGNQPGHQRALGAAAAEEVSAASASKAAMGGGKN